MIDTYTDWLKGLTYKPNWRFRVGVQPDGHAVLNIDASVIDSRNPDRGRITIGTSVPLMENLQYEEFLECWRNGIRQAELHEMDEWLRVNGELKWDPHRNEMPRQFTGTLGSGTHHLRVWR